MSHHLLEQALVHARNGVPVFPLAGKRPITDNGLHDATTDEDQIREWWADRPDANVGIPTGAVSGLVVVDVDGPEGEDTLAQLEAENGRLPVTMEVTTGKGRHLYFTHPGGHVKSGAGERSGLGKGVDIRGDGGYVVGPKSVHPETGAVYAVTEASPPNTMPEWVGERRDRDRTEEAESILERLRDKARGVTDRLPPFPLPERETDVGTRKALRQLAHEAALVANETEQGGRNHLLNETCYVVGRWIAGGYLDQDYAVDVMLEAAIESGYVADDGYHVAEGTIASGMESGLLDPHVEPGPTEWVKPEEAYRPGRMLYTLDDLAHLPPVTFLVDDLVPARALVTVYGPPGSYKSFLVLDWALSVASGRSWHGRDVRQGSVVYVAAEGAPGIRKRALAWLKANPDADPGDRFRVVPRAVNMLDADSVLDLRQALREELEDEPALIIVDTLARSMPGGEENSSTDMGLVVEAADTLRHDYKATVVFVHHAGKDESRGERGSTALSGAMDARYQVSAQKESLRATLKCHKMKDRAEPRPLELHLEQVGPSLVVKPGVLDDAAKKRMVVETLLLGQEREDTPEGMGMGELRRRLPLHPEEAERAVLAAVADERWPVVRHRPEGYAVDLFMVDPELDTGDEGR